MEKRISKLCMGSAIVISLLAGSAVVFFGLKSIARDYDEVPSGEQSGRMGRMGGGGQMGGGPPMGGMATMVAGGSNLFILRGNQLFKISMSDLSVVKKTMLEEPKRMDRMESEKGEKGYEEDNFPRSPFSEE